ncbi:MULTISPECIES: hypothetical protein [unclassified Rathayibacter]|nr:MULTISPECIES: hypothetical protein [unclassified Rathayibacter]ROP45317.1 hypothetical protein EDF45_3493 [Rathayibacter sp. PhB186]ROS48195.1 hypothetical protein EDF44_3468 [Rathayibacter sp. PhB185]
MLALLLVLAIALALLAAVAVPLALAVRRDGYSPVAFDRAYDSRGGGA